jgi:hypothetical protein
MIKWTDKKSVLMYKGKIFKAGDAIPAGILSENQTADFKSLKKIKVDEPAKPEPKPVKVIEPEPVKIVEKKERPVKKIEPEPESEIIPEPEITEDDDE